MPFCTLPHPQPNGLEICSFYDNGQKNKAEQRFYTFANYSRHPVRIKDDLLGDITWPTTEHYFQAQKFKTEAGRRAFYNDTKNEGPDSARKKAFPNNAKRYEATFNTSDWHSRKKDVMLIALRAKYDQHKTTLEPLLRETGNLPIVEDTAGADYEDNEWGCGYSGNGNNLLGLLWMQVRAEKLHGKAPNDAKEEATQLQAQAKESLMALGPRGDKDNKQHGTLLQNFSGVKTVYQRHTIGQVDPTLPAAVPSLNKIQPFTVQFDKDKDRDADSQRQANEIIAEFEHRLKADPNAKVAITYSANNDQVVDIVKGYTTGQYSIDGSNQAQVIKLVIEEIIRRKWQDKAHILPIATSQHSGGSGVIRMDQVDRDLANIAQHLGAGWQVLGFKNQATAAPGTYAIGDGVSKAIWKGNFKERFDAQMKKMTEGDFSDPVLQQAYQYGQQKGVPLMSPAQLKPSAPTKPIVTTTKQTTHAKALESTHTVSHLMKAFKIPADVEQLAKIGNNAYKTGKVTTQSWVMRADPAALQNPWPLPQAGGGRQGDWIKNTFGHNEAEIIKQLKSAPPPQTISAKDIRSAYGAQSITDSQDLPQFTIVQGVGVNDLHKTPLGQEALLQVASQFDFQESPGAYEFPVTSYLEDRTQGPQASIESASSALHRKAAKQAGTLDHALVDLLPKELLDKYPTLYRHGYLEINQITNPADKQQLLDHISNNIEKIKVLPQWTLCEASGAKQMQVFCAAPSFQGGSTPKEGSVEDKICKKLVVAQYVALAQLAVIRSREIGQTVPLHLTLVGQGAFNNHPTVMKEAMDEVAKIIKGNNVAVYIHAYDQNADNILKSQMQGSYTVKTMSAEIFKTQPHPSQVSQARIDTEPTVQLQPKQQAHSNPKVGIQVRRKKTQPSETLTEPSVSTTQPTMTSTPSVTKPSPILTAFSQDKDNQFPLNLTTKLTSLFQETNWEINTPNNAIITITDKQDTSKQVHIKKEEDAIRLSTVHTDATATEALYQSTAAIEPAQDEVLEFNVEMTHHYDWKVQLKKMHDSGIDIENIKSLKVDGKEIIEAAKPFIQEIKQASEKEHLFVLQRRN